MNRSSIRDARRASVTQHCRAQRFVGSVFASLLLVLLTLPIDPAQAEQWDRFRGPNGAGQSDAQDIPSEWSARNVLWKRALTGVGHSSPVIWHDRLYTLSAEPETGRQLVLAFDPASGEPLWQRTIDAPSYSIHNFNSLASSTPAVDARGVYVLWLAGERVLLAAFSHDGDELWRRDVGPFEEQHGFGKSPIVVDGLVCVANDSEAESAVVAFDAATGEARWRVPRDSGTTAFATPCLLEPGASRKTLITASTASGIGAIELASGRVLWQGLADELPQRCVASPIVAHGLVLVTCGAGGNGKVLVAARPGDATKPPELEYRLQKAIPNVPTPVVAGELLFLWHDRGVVSCYDVSTGRQHWRERIGGNFHSSPLHIAGRIFCASRDGEVVVLAADTTFKLLARNLLYDLNENDDASQACHATPAVARGRLYVRTESSLWCIGDSARTQARQKEENRVPGTTPRLRTSGASPQAPRSR